jgi:hypothetical protein
MKIDGDAINIVEAISLDKAGARFLRRIRYLAGKLPQNWGSGGDSCLQMVVVGSREELPEAGAERAVVDGTADLEQSIGRWQVDGRCSGWPIWSSLTG